jgi:hypothetical protein
MLTKRRFSYNFRRRLPIPRNKREESLMRGFKGWPPKNMIVVGCCLLFLADAGNAQKFIKSCDRVDVLAIEVLRLSEREVLHDVHLTKYK